MRSNYWKAISRYLDANNLSMSANDFLELLVAREIPGDFFLDEEATKPPKEVDERQLNLYE